MNKTYRIFLVLFGSATSMQHSGIWQNNIYNSLKASGHHVYLCNPQKYLEQFNVKRYNKKARPLLADKIYNEYIQQSQKTPFDIFFSYLNAAEVEPELIRNINSRVFTVNYTTNFHQFDLYKEIASYAAINIFVSAQAKPGFDELGVRSYYMPLAANPAYYSKYTGKTPKSNDISFVGAAYGNRPYLLWRILQNDLELNIYGPGWKRKRSIKNLIHPLYTGLVSSIRPTSTRLRKTYGLLQSLITYQLNTAYKMRVHSTVDDDSYLKLLASSKIFLNIQLSRYNHDFLNPGMLLGSNLRDHEVTSAGTFLCTTYSEEVAALYDPGKEICTYYNEYEMIEKLRYYLKNETEREKIALAGQQRAIREHTWEQRFNRFFEHIADSI